MRYARSGIVIQLNNVKNTEFEHPDSKKDAVLMPVIKKNKNKQQKGKKHPKPFKPPTLYDKILCTYSSSFTSVELGKEFAIPRLIFTTNNVKREARQLW